MNQQKKKKNINQDDLVKIKQYNALNLNILQKIAHQRNKNTTGLKKKNLIYTLIRSEKSHKKDNYIKYLNKNTNNEIHNEINKLRLQLLNISPYLKKEYLNQIRKRLYDIEKKTSKNRAEKKNYVKNYQKDQLILNIKDNIYQLIIEIITIHIYKILSICLIVQMIIINQYQHKKFLIIIIKDIILEVIKQDKFRYLFR